MPHAPAVSTITRSSKLNLIKRATLWTLVYCVGDLDPMDGFQHGVTTLTTIIIQKTLTRYEGLHLRRLRQVVLTEE